MAEPGTPAAMVTLIVDDSPTVLESIRATLGVVGISTVDTCKNILDARRRMGSKRYELVLCDYNLGMGQESGQQFLESLRRKGELSLSTIFIMVTAENTYERVVATAEIAPDDYLLKPFTPQHLLDRVFRAHRKKNFLKPLFDAIESGNVELALMICDTLINAKSMYDIDVLRYKAELLVGVGEDAQAQETYEEVLKRKVTPWAKMGLARILARNEKFEASNEMLQEIVAENKVFLAAHDLLVSNATALGDEEAALQYSKQALEISPGSAKRLKSTADLAFKTGDVETATQLLERAVNADSLSSSLDLMARVRLTDVYCQTKQYTKATEQLQICFKQNKANNWASKCSELLMLEAAGRMVVLHQELQNAVNWFREPDRNLDDALLILRLAIRGQTPEFILRSLIVFVSERFGYSTREIRDIEKTVGPELANDAEVAYRRGLQHNRNLMTEATTGSIDDALRQGLDESDRTLNERTILTTAAICAKSSSFTTKQLEDTKRLLTVYVTTSANMQRKQELLKQLGMKEDWSCV